MGLQVGDARGMRFADNAETMSRVTIHSDRTMPNRYHSPFILVALTAAAVACAKTDRGATDSAGGTAASRSAPAQPCTGDNGGLTLPAGFCATVFADSLGHARHLAISANGDVYVNTWSGPYYTTKPPAAGFVVALRDTNRDGRADQVARFGSTPARGGKGGTGIALYNGFVYAEDGNRILRYSLPSGQLAAGDSADTILRGLPMTGDHPIFPFVIDSAGTMYMNSGSATNACQAKNRVAGSPGRDPCARRMTKIRTPGAPGRRSASCEMPRALTPADSP